MSEEQQAQSPVENEAAKPVANEDLRAQLEALKAKNSELISERRKDKENRDRSPRRIRRVQTPLGRCPDNNLFFEANTCRKRSRGRAN